MTTTTFALPTSEKQVLTAAVPQIVAGSRESDLVITVPTGTTVDKLEVTTATADDVNSGANVWVQEGTTLVGPVIHKVAQRVTAIRLTSNTGGIAYILRAI